MKLCVALFTFASMLAAETIGYETHTERANGHSVLTFKFQKSLPFSPHERWSLLNELQTRYGNPSDSASINSLGNQIQVPLRTRKSSSRLMAQLIQQRLRKYQVKLQNTSAGKTKKAKGTKDDLSRNSSWEHSGITNASYNATTLVQADEFDCINEEARARNKKTEPDKKSSISVQQLKKEPFTLTPGPSVVRWNVWKQQ